MGWVCYTLASRASERALITTLESARARLGIEVNIGSDIDAMTDEFERLFKEVLGHPRRRPAWSTATSGRSRHRCSPRPSEQASGAAQQAAAVTETSATVEELAQTSKQIAENSQSVAAIAERTLASAEEGMQTVADTADGIEEIRESTQAASDRILALGERSQEIGRVLVIIDDIAEQTKILALNAAIEAARAGEAGKGFAVVAEEIRKLADSVTESTSEIGRVVREIQSSRIVARHVDREGQQEGRRGQDARAAAPPIRSRRSSTRSRRRPTRRSRSRSRRSSSAPPPTRSSSRCARWRRWRRSRRSPLGRSRRAIIELNRLADTLEVR